MANPFSLLPPHSSLSGAHQSLFSPPLFFSLSFDHPLITIMEQHWPNREAYPNMNKPLLFLRTPCACHIFKNPSQFNFTQSCFDAIHLILLLQLTRNIGDRSATHREVDHALMDGSNFAQNFLTNSKAIHSLPLKRHLVSTLPNAQQDHSKNQLPIESPYLRFIP